MNITDGGYDDGYEAVQCFWGVEPGSLVADYLERHTQKLRSARALDLGCGEGKNAAALTRAGYTVDAIECSHAAIANGKILFSDVDIRWLHADVRDIQLPRQKYDLVVAYGLYHCLCGIEQVVREERGFMPI